MERKTALFALLLLAATASGCATYARTSFEMRQSLSAGDYNGAARAIEGHRRGPDELLYLMETGLMAHRKGDYAKSNACFEEAERLADRLFTRSATRVAAALLTNDAVRAYRGEAFERVYINYYRALNYWYLGLPEDALVECRKANLKLARYASSDGNAYSNDAFIHYLTGLIYEATGELNDAWVSYCAARDAYDAQDGAFGPGRPETLDADLERVEALLDAGGRPRYQLAAYEPHRAGATSGEVVVISEIGFVPRKVQEEVNLPIYAGDVKSASTIRTERVARRIAHRRHHHAPRGDVEYWLRAAMPVYSDQVQPPRSVRLTSVGTTAVSQTVENLDGVARATFAGHQDAVLARTVARGLAKYIASRQLKKKSRILGFLANLFAASTEAADTRGWVSLPGRIQMGRLHLPAGTHRIHLEVLDGSGRVVETAVLDSVEVRAGERTFVNFRTYS